MTTVALNFAAVRRRIRSAFAAYLFARTIRVAEQIILVPLFLSSWGAQLYGEWLAVAALAGFAAIANLGVGQAAAAEVVLQSTRNELGKASRVVVTSLVTIVASITVGLVGLGLILAVADLRALVGIGLDDMPTPALLVVMLAAATLITFLSEPLAGTLSAAHGAAVPNAIAAISKTIELVCIAIALRAGAGPLAIAGTMLAGAALNVTFHVAWTLRRVTWFSFSVANFDLEFLIRTWRSAAGFFLIFVCINILGVYLPRLLVSHSLGPVALATFSVLATYTKTARNLATMTSQATQVEIGRLWASGETKNVRRLIRRMLRNATLLAAVLLLAELVLAPTIVPRWTGGHIPLDWALMIALALVALLGCYVDGVLLAASALNQVGLIAFGYALGLLIGIVGAAILLPWTGHLAIIGIGLLLPEIGGAFSGSRTLGRMARQSK
ncbi:hypothetical protein HZZ13_19270 [Bradyrhizobium sp. CNPSo 4010]|uniref:Membrane protein involved in the export of O-antigen and teichoic acid n=1 Tax=Bradyrhizobium agreste TaxID=2751811 RepID=A0ABS0PSG3_9BRAD|nr:hypothetical protein [Bradyrhizobium agreste]MBH5399911.1 hypothetical protein [Bradyrhizobium agreste]